MKLIPISYPIYSAVKAFNEAIVSGEVEGLVIGIKLQDGNAMTITAGLTLIEVLGLAEHIKLDTTEGQI